MSDVERRAILEAVARGELTPDIAAQRLRYASHDLQVDDPLRAAASAVKTEATTSEPTADDRPAESTPRAEPARREVLQGEPIEPARQIRIEASAGAVRVVGDPTVAVVDVDGDHDVNEEGDTIVVRCSPLRDIDFDFDFDGMRRGGAHRGRRGPAFVMHRRGGPLALADIRRRVQVTVRVNPDLPIHIRASAGSVTLRGVNAPVTCDVDAGAVRLHDLTAPFTARVNAGALSVDAKLTEGTSRVSCDMGSASVRLDPSSDVRIDAHVNLGRCSVHLGEDADGDDLAMLGSGAATLIVDGSMASVSVSTD